jgi:hypothetical protein
MNSSKITSKLLILVRPSLCCKLVEALTVLSRGRVVACSYPSIHHQDLETTVGRALEPSDRSEVRNNKKKIQAIFQEVAHKR